jgi:hypothetical protein
MPKIISLGEVNFLKEYDEKQKKKIQNSDCGKSILF